MTEILRLLENYVIKYFAISHFCLVFNFIVLNDPVDVR